MPAPRIPPRHPIADRVSGSIMRSEDLFFLVDSALADSVIGEEREWIVRYGVPYLGRPHFSIVPGLLALDYGEFLTGEAAWDFLMKRSNLYPRSDVIGYRNDGQDDMVVVKALDLARRPHILIYQDEEQTRPYVQIEAIITLMQGHLPDRLREYAVVVESLDDWRKTSP